MSALLPVTSQFLLPVLLVLATGLAHGQKASRAEVTAALEQFEKYFNNKNQHVRKAALMGLGDTNHEDVVPALLRGVSDSAEVVRRQVTPALAKQTTGEAHKRMLRALKDRKDLAVQEAILVAFKATRPALIYQDVLKLTQNRTFEVRVLAAELLGLLPAKGNSSEKALEKLTGDGDPQVRLAAIASLGQLGSTTLSDLCLRLLEEDRDWRVRATCIATVAQFRLKRTIQPLIDAMQREKGRLRDDCHAALVEITGEVDAHNDAERWQAWFDRVGERWEVPSLAELAKRRKLRDRSDAKYQSARRDYEPFVGIETRSQRMLFLLDISGSMADNIDTASSDPRKQELFRQRFGDYDTKIELAREELINTIASLKSYVKFNIVTFHTKVKPWKKGLVAAGTGNKNSAIKFLARLTPAEIRNISMSNSEAGRTNTFDVLNHAFGLTKKPTTRPTKNHKVDSDTVFLVTDGMPTAGRITDPDELLRYFKAVNGRAKLVFHCITFGHTNEHLLRPIAVSSGGQFLIVSIDG